jgi:hypothetical protein
MRHVSFTKKLPQLLPQLRFVTQVVSNYLGTLPQGASHVIELKGPKQELRYLRKGMGD